jgi:hypothetical protein
VAKDHRAAQEKLDALMDEWEDAAEVASEQ